MDRLRKQLTKRSSAPAVKRPEAGAQTPDPHTTEQATDSAEAAAADTTTGLGPNSQAPTLRHDMHDQQ